MALFFDVGGLGVPGDDLGEEATAGAPVAAVALSANHYIVNSG